MLTERIGTALANTAVAALLYATQAKGWGGRRSEGREPTGTQDARPRDGLLLHSSETGGTQHSPPQIHSVPLALPRRGDAAPGHTERYGRFHHGSTTTSGAAVGHCLGTRPCLCGSGSSRREGQPCPASPGPIFCRLEKAAEEEKLKGGPANSCPLQGKMAVGPLLQCECPTQHLSSGRQLQRAGSTF